MAKFGFFSHVTAAIVWYTPITEQVGHAARPAYATARCLSWLGRPPAGPRKASGRATQASAWPDRPRILRAAQKFSFSRRQFSRVTLFFQPIHWPHRELQNRENRILKLHTNLEIFASNPILKTHFFELGELCICKKSYILWSAICSMKRHKF